MMQQQRAAGILLHISSLPSPYGIGTLGKAAYEFVDFLVRARQRYWQILPLGCTSYGDSPYSSFSTFAGNPYFIDLDTLCDEGLLQPDEYQNLHWAGGESHVDYANMFVQRYPVLRLAYQRDRADLTAFVQQHQGWIEDFALYMALKWDNDLTAWSKWEDGLKRRDSQALADAKVRLQDNIRFFIWQQYHFFKQWEALKAYANQQGISIVGDLPIYVASDSADTWSNPHLFEFDDTLTPNAVAGCPPDGFSETGQLWGNPLYRWQAHKDSGYDWWTRRIQSAFTLYDVVRIDHFRGFESYWSIPYGDKTAQNGHWEQGPGMDLFYHLQAVLGDLNIIAEDLGYLTPEVHKLLKDSGYPGMKVLQFACSAPDNLYLPHQYQKHCVVYTGTHDNDTMCGWFEHASVHELEFAREYFGFVQPERQHWDMIRVALRSVANTAIVPMQDYLSQGGSARMNTPSTLGGNWEYRMLPDAIDQALTQKIADLTHLYYRD